jgi:hypothetical protein
MSGSGSRGDGLPQDYLEVRRRHLGPAAVADPLLTLRPPKIPRSRAEDLAELTREVALVGIARGERNLRYREIGASQHSLSLFDAPLNDVVVRCYTRRVLELSCEMIDREPCNNRQFCELYALVQVRFHIFADTTHGAG